MALSDLAGASTAARGIAKMMFRSGATARSDGPIDADVRMDSRPGLF